MLNYQALAEFLKYLGLIVGTASSIWGALNDLKHDGPDGRKRLTTAGKASIAITVISLVVSLTSAAVGDNLAREADRRAEAKHQAETISQIQRHQEVISGQLQALALSEKAREEQRQRFDGLAGEEAHSTREILIAGQSLRAISLTWTFPAAESISDVLFKDFNNDVGELDKEWGFDPHRGLYYERKAYLNRDDVVRSLLNLMGGANSDNGSVLAVFTLDDAAAVVLPVGFLEVGQIERRHGVFEQSAAATLPLTDIDIAAGIELSGEGSPARKREFASWEALPQVSRYGAGVRMEWNLEGVNCTRAIDKADPSLIAVLPQEMRVLVLTRIKTLPLNPSRTSEVTGYWLPWTSRAAAKEVTPRALRNSKLRLIPNGYPIMATTYEMELVDLTQIYDDEPEKFYSWAALWKGRRLPPRQR